ncbi:hypothetical protein E2562_012647 [Oryza meyeriana var. granulata]|uniref:RNA exonuclease 4 n=1 Tax=Oryza meyeriana var. granulata TaxID=110450 RepID=A0A6G1CGQ1_9ORYZ|nr:hypothetical protein E2562_012647 [Oryza meyeriana var. granulata]
MDSSSDAHRRNRCAACFREFNKKEHLVEHMRTSLHSPHDPRCAVCAKHCRSLDALRDHLTGALPKPECAASFASRGCALCLDVLPAAGALRSHSCPKAPQPLGGVLALGCKMVGAGSDGSLDVCARVCVVDEQECVVFESFVKPQIPVTHYRYETTGIRPEHLRDGAMTPKQAARRVQELLLNGELAWKARSSRGRARILVGHGLDHDLEALGMDYPAYLKRDTARYPPLMKTSNSRLSNSLKYLTLAYLGYHIQAGGHHQHPYDDCVAALRLYRRMRARPHCRDQREAGVGPHAPPPTAPEAFPAWRQRELERMSAEELLQLSTTDYYCWCLDATDH